MIRNANVLISGAGIAGPTRTFASLPAAAESCVEIGAKRRISAPQVGSHHYRRDEIPCYHHVPRWKSQGLRLRERRRYDVEPRLEYNEEDKRTGEKRRLTLTASKNRRRSDTDRNERGDVNHGVCDDVGRLAFSARCSSRMEEEVAKGRRHEERRPTRGVDYKEPERNGHGSQKPSDRSLTYH